MWPPSLRGTSMNRRTRCNSAERYQIASCARAFALVLCATSPFVCHAAPAAPRATQNIVLVTLDGVRTQEFFSGMDETIAASEEDSGIDEIEVVRKRYWRETPEARREALMPKLWTELAPQGVVLGNK